VTQSHCGIDRSASLNPAKAGSAKEEILPGDKVNMAKRPPAGRNALPFLDPTYSN